MMALEVRADVVLPPYGHEAVTAEVPAVSLHHLAKQVVDQVLYRSLLDWLDLERWAPVESAVDQSHVYGLFVFHDPL